METKVEMTKEKALEILDKAVSQLNATRQVHSVYIMALQYLSNLSEKKDSSTDGE